jgi:exopolysaccharide production protein ExoZ
MNNKKQLELIQGFRGIAALLVLMFHVSGTYLDKYKGVFFYNIFSQGYSGVDFFFVLSGFIIYFVNAKDIGSRSKYKQYILKRLIRIYPIHWVATTFMLLIFLTFGFGKGLADNFMIVIKTYLLFPQEAQLNGVVWTLTHEVFFYIMFSLLILIKRRRVSFSILFIWLLISAFLFIIDVESENFYIKFIFSKYNLEFALGCLMGHMVLNYRLKIKYGILFLGIISLFFSWTINYKQIVQVDRVIAYGIPFSLIILGGGALAYYKNFKIPSFLNTIGDASYSIYLSHLTLLNSFIDLFELLGVYRVIGHRFGVNIIVFLTIIFGCLFYVIFEKPILKVLRKRFALSNVPMLLDNREMQV